MVGDGGGGCQESQLRGEGSQGSGPSGWRARKSEGLR